MIVIKNVPEFLNKISQRRQKRRIILLVTLCLSAAVALGVYWSLHTNGQAKTGNVIHPTLICGQEEGENHHHTGKCYDPERSCGMTEHQHTEQCYTQVTDAE